MSSEVGVGKGPRTNHNRSDYIWMDDRGNQCMLKAFLLRAFVLLYCVKK